jgi:uncharacterized protein (UPF0147 family)
MNPEPEKRNEGTVTVPRLELNRVLDLAENVAPEIPGPRRHEFLQAVSELKKFVTNPTILSQAEMEIAELTQILGDKSLPENERIAIEKILEECRKFESHEQEAIAAEIASLQNLLDDEEEMSAYEKRLIQIRVGGLRIRQSGEEIPGNTNTPIKPDLPGKPD